MELFSVSLCIIVHFLALLHINLSLDRECNENADCARTWPNATCNRRGRCACPPNSLRRNSDRRGWVCLSLVDSVTGMLGPPATCPLPEGAGYAVIERDSSGESVFCKVDGGADECGAGHECIQAAGEFSADWDGVCCPMARELICSPLPAGNGLGGRLERWFFDGTQCTQFWWAPEQTIRTKCPNTYVTKGQCESFCGKESAQIQSGKTNRISERQMTRD